MQNLKEFREKAGLTQTELGAKVGLSASAIKRIENQNRKPRVDNALRMAKVLKTTVAKLYGKLEKAK